jgi:hypothetical protein
VFELCWLSTTGARDGSGLAAKTVHEVHMIVRSSLDLATRRQLIEVNVAHATTARQPDGAPPERADTAAMGATLRCLKVPTTQLADEVVLAASSMWGDTVPVGFVLGFRGECSG